MTTLPPDDKAEPRGVILAALMCTMMLAAMDVTIVSTAIPQIVADLGGFRLFSWVFSIYLLAQTVTIPVYGKLSDLYGRKPVLIIGTLIFLLGSTLSSLSWDMLSLIVFRGLQGLGAGAIMATVSTLAGDLYSIEKRGVVQGWLSSVWAMAAILGPLLGGAFAEYFTWRWIFLINLPLGLLALILIWTYLHESFERRQHRIDYLGSALVLASVGTIMVGLLEGGHAWPWLGIESIALFCGAAVLIALTILVERHAAEPVLPGWLWRSPLIWGSNLAMVGMGVVMMGPSLYLPTFMQSVHGLGAIGAGMVLASMSLGWPVASALSPRLYMWIGFRDTALLGAVLLVLGSAGFLLLPQPEWISAVVLVQVVLGAGFGLLSTSVLVGLQSTVGWDQRGVITGANMFGRYLGQTLGAAVFGSIFNASIAAHLSEAPRRMASDLPANVNDIIEALHQSATEPAVASYLRGAIDLATRHLFLGMAVISVLMLALLFVLPRHFPVIGQHGAHSAKG